MAVPDDPAGRDDGPVPDDAAALDADRADWLREERVRLRRRTGWRRLVWTRRWQRFGLSGPLVVLCLLATSVVGALAVVLVPRPATPPPRAAPLAAAPRITVPVAGDVPAAAVPTVERSGDLLGRRLPEALLEGDAGVVRTASVRPAMVVLVPGGCACPGAVDELYRQAREFRVSVWLVSAAGPDAAGTAATRRALAALDAAETAGGARWAVDPDGTLVRALRGRGLTVALVRPDGVVTDVLRDVGPTARDVPAMEIALAGLVPRR